MKVVHALVVGTIALSVCDSPDRQRTQARAHARPAAGDTAEVGGEVVDSTAAIGAQAWITDANALALLAVMNARQIAAADIELEGWHTAEVRAFAALVAREHEALQHTADSLAGRLHLAPVMSALDLKIDSAFRARVDSLRGLTPPALERAFTREQAVAEQAIADYAEQLTGAARAPEVRALMESAATGARARVTRAQGFAATLALADSVKRAAAADSAARAAERAAARARHRTPPL